MTTADMEDALEAVEAALPDGGDSEWIVVGGRLREARSNAGISVRELARRIDVSPSHVSQVERGLAAFSVRALYNVVNELGIPMDSLFDGVPQAGESSSSPQEPSQPLDEQTPLDTSGVVLRAAQRPTIKLKSGPRWERLTSQAEEGCEFLSVVYDANPSGEPPEDFIRHTGREYGVVVYGELHVQVGFGQATLGPGDSIAFDSSVPHRFWNATNSETRCVWFVMNDDGSTDGLHQHI